MALGADRYSSVFPKPDPIWEVCEVPICQSGWPWVAVNGVVDCPVGPLAVDPSLLEVAWATRLRGSGSARVSRGEGCAVSL